MLLDTHVLLWLLTDDDSFGPLARSRVSSAAAVQVSAASLWEIAIKAELGKLGVPADLVDRVGAAGVRVLPVSAAHAWASREVTGLPHRDPFDRLLVAQAATEGLPLVTADRALLGATLSPGVGVVDARA